jgi:hypothetical protein
MTYPSSSDDSGAGAVLGAIVLGLFLVISAIVGLWEHSTARDVTITVTRLDDQPTGNSHQYLVFTPQGVFKDTDADWFLKFNSSDLFIELQVGRSYRCEVEGARNHFTSGYPNLVTCTRAARRG